MRYKVYYEIDYNHFITQGDIKVNAKTKKEAESKAKKEIEKCHDGKAKIISVEKA